MNRSGELAESEDPKPENNDSSNSGMDSASSGSPPSLPVSASVNAEGEVPKLGTNDPSKAPSGSGAADGLSSSAPASPNLNPPEDKRKRLSIIKPRATGPVTERGKARSKRNAFRHGIFSSPLLIGEENAEVYHSLLKGLTVSLDPQGALETILVEKLATNVWRHRRLLQAESSAIEKHKEEVLCEKEQREDRKFDFHVQMELALALSDREGLLSKIAKPGALQDCIERLSGVRKRIDQDDRSEDDTSDWVDFARIYGARFDGRPGRDLYDVYLDCANVTHYSGDELRERGLVLPDTSKKKFLVELDREIERLERLPKKPKPPDLELLACKVPNAPELDRLLRYEASLERAFDRTLNQLERIQRVRKGQAVPAPISVNVSAS